MGFDISYHPIKEEEIQEWYFRALDNQSHVEKLIAESGMQDFYADKYKNTLSIGKETPDTEVFDKTHGFYIAIVQGFFRKYFYTRGSAFSFLMEQFPLFKDYTKSWQEIIPGIKNPANNKITENYCSGVYIPADEVVKLLRGYMGSKNINEILTEFYSHQRLSVFINALKFAEENNMGLLEATEVVEPNPLDLNNSKSYSNLFNCDTEGALLYQETAMEQIREIERQNNLPEGEISKNAEYTKTDVNETEQKEKKGFWKKLFGK
ncbi:MAG: hypothetical protein LBV72_08430 [Tannerella sp.]|jgi:hypothetical protein|nr:hypothetical protein [Tannerella sp.]